MIRFATTKDAYQIATIHVASWQKAYRGLLPDKELDNLSITESEREWRDLINKNVNVLLIEQKNQVVGFASIGASRDSNIDQTLCGEISALYLHPDVWRQGLGKMLCAAALLELKKLGFSEVVLWVVEGNAIARRFYESMGFAGTGDSKMDVFVGEFALKEVRYWKVI